MVETYRRHWVAPPRKPLAKQVLGIAASVPALTSTNGATTSAPTSDSGASNEMPVAPPGGFSVRLTAAK